jgi:hypothetical protein
MMWLYIHLFVPLDLNRVVKKKPTIFNSSFFKVSTLHVAPNIYKTSQPNPMCYIYGFTFREHFIYLFWIWETSSSRKAYFVGPGKRVKLRLFQTFIKDIRPDSNLRFVVQILNSLSSRYAYWKHNTEHVIWLERAWESSENIWSRSFHRSHRRFKYISVIPETFYSF